MMDAVNKFMSIPDRFIDAFKSSASAQHYQLNDNGKINAIVVKLIKRISN